MLLGSTPRDAGVDGVVKGRTRAFRHARAAERIARAFDTRPHAA